MEEGRSVNSSGVVVKNRNSSGCLIVRRKGDALSGRLGSYGSGKTFEAKKGKKRPKMVLSDSGSSDELLNPSYRRVGLETVRLRNDLAVYERGFVEESGICRKHGRLERKWFNENVSLSRNGLDESERKRSKINVFDFNEYNGIDKEMLHRKLYDDIDADFSERRLMGSMHVPHNGFEREYETGSSKFVVDNRRNLYLDRKSGFSREHICRSRHDNDRTHLPLLRDKYISHSSEAIRLQGKNGVLKVMVNKKKSLGGSLEKYNFQKTEKTRQLIGIEDTATKNVQSPPFYSETELLHKPDSVVRTKNNIKTQQFLPTKKSKGYDDPDLEDSGASMKLESKSLDACKSKKVSHEGKDVPCEMVHLNKVKEGKVRRGSGTEKQKLREKIRAMLLDAGWTIDYRPRRNRDYLDAVYINPFGTAYWSIIKAYDALQKQLNDEDNEAKPSGDGSFAPIRDDVLSQLTRKTRKKLEKEMKRKQRDELDGEKARAAAVKKSTNAKHNIDRVTHDDKLSSFIKLSGKSFKNRVNENGFAGAKSDDSDHHLYDTVEKLPFGSSSHMVSGGKSKKLGRCTLIVRGPNKGLNSETDGFVPYTGKRTLLSWLIDSGSVQLSQKVQYINRRTTQIMLEGWITREGIHCGCCSKVLTISKFAIHAGSKLRQPYQNIYLDSGISLLQCQIDAWNRLVESEKIGFNSVDIDGDDPNDDACGICGDGGDLICCDSCPSTFHQSCLCIQMLPTGNWHCPNCTCKFCGMASKIVGEENFMYNSELFICSLCEKKYHNSCVEDVDVTRADSNILAPCFCGQKCKELFEHLQKYVGVKHDLEAGFSWSLIHRTDENSDISNLGVPQKVECNLKLAAALTIMDECFMPIVDRRSEINLIHNVVYNCGSNFNRLNHSGFYTVVLERGDEVISAASIRFHGIKLVEMPFIGTRHIYRRQGMCRRLFGAIESVLCSLKVERLIIPAISELMYTWTTVFSFTPLEKSLKREMRSMNMLVFPGIDMLQKLILVQEDEANTATNTGMKKIECNDKQHIKPEMEVENDADCSATRNLHGDDHSQLCLAKEKTQEATGVDSDSQSMGVTLNNTSVVSGSLDVSYKHENPHTTVGIMHLDSHSEAKFAGTSNVIEMENKPVQHSCLKDNEQCTAQFQDTSLNDNAMSGSLDACNELKVQVSSERTTFSDSQSEAKYISERKCLSPPGTSHVHSEDIPLLEFNSKINLRSLEEDMDGSHELSVKDGSHEKSPATGEIFADNTTEEDNEKIDNSDSYVTGTRVLC